MENAAISASILQSRDPWALYRDVEHAWEVWNAGSDVSSNVQARITESNRRVWARECPQHSFSRQMSFMDSIVRDDDNTRSTYHKWTADSYRCTRPTRPKPGLEVHCPYLQLNGAIKTVERKLGEEECELFGDPPQVEGDPVEALLEQDQGMERQDELHIATVPVPSNQDCFESDRSKVCKRSACAFRPTSRWFSLNGVRFQ